MGRCTDTLTVQTGLASPLKVFVFAHYGVGDVVISRLIFGYDQAVDLITSRFDIMSHVFIRSGSQDRVHILHTIEFVTPVVRVRPV